MKDSNKMVSPRYLQQWTFTLICKLIIYGGKKCFKLSNKLIKWNPFWKCFGIETFLIRGSVAWVT